MAKILLIQYETEGARVCHLSGLDKELTDGQIESLSDIDILLIDIGITEDSNEIASKIVNQIEPRIVIPIGYNPEKKASVFLKKWALPKLNRRTN